MCHQSAPGILGFVCTNDGEQVVSLEKLTCCLVPGTRPGSVASTSNLWHYSREEERTPPDMVVNEAVRNLLLPEILYGICPKDIGHEAMCGRFPEPIDLYEQRGRDINNMDVRGVILTARMSSRVLSSGERPPWMHRNCLFIMAARGNEQKDSMHAS